MTIKRVWRVDAVQVLGRSGVRGSVVAGLGATQAPIRPFRADALEITGEGYHLYDALVARTGLQDYEGVIEYRPYDEVLASLPSYELRPLTDLHPSRNIDSTTARVHARGAFGPAHMFEEDAASLEVAHVAARIAVWDGELQTKFDAATSAGSPMHISMGYGLDLDMTPGTTQWGKHYDAVQRRMAINHGSAVPVGRAGTATVLLDAAGWDLGQARTLADCSGKCGGVVYVDLGWSRRDDFKTQAPRPKKTPKKDEAPMKVKFNIDGVGDGELELDAKATPQAIVKMVADAMNAGFAKFIKKKGEEEEGSKKKKAKKDAADLAIFAGRQDALVTAKTIIGIGYPGKPTELGINLDTIEAVDGKDARAQVEAMREDDQPGAARLLVARAASKHGRRDERALGLLDEINRRGGDRTDAEKKAEAEYRERTDAQVEAAAMTPTERRTKRAS